MDSHSNSNNDEAKKAEQKMLDAIRSGEAKIRPRWHFILETALMVVGGIIALLFVLYLASFIIFVLQQTGVWFAPAFGAPGWYSFFSSLPWLLILLLIIFMLILALLAKRYSVVYERPTIYLFISIVLMVVIGGLLIASTPFHRDLLNDSRGGGLPVLGGFYRGYGMQGPDDIHRGMIIGTTTNGFIIQDPNGQTSTVSFNRPDQGPPPGSPGPGSNVVIFGPRTPSGTIHEQGMQQVGQP